MSEKEGKKDAILHRLLFGVSRLVRRRHKKTKTGNFGCSVILLSVLYHLPILIFAGVRRQIPPPPSLSLPLFSLSLLLSLSPSLSPSMYMVIGWLFSQHWRGLNLLCLHPLWSVPCVRSLSISSSENKHNKLLKRCQRGDGLQNQPRYDKCNRCSFHPFVSKRPECRSEPKKNRKNLVAFVTVRAAAAEEPRTWRRETPFHFITGKCGRETSANTILT